MPVAKLTLELEIHHAQSLKDRRQVVRSVRDTLRRGFNVSVAELDEALIWNRATLGIVALSRSTTYLEGQLQQAEDAARRACTRYGAEIIDASMELLASDLPDSLSDNVPDHIPDHIPDHLAEHPLTLESTPATLAAAPGKVTSVPRLAPQTSSDPPTDSAIVSLLEDRNA